MTFTTVRVSSSFNRTTSPTDTYVVASALVVMAVVPAAAAAPTSTAGRYSLVDVTETCGQRRDLKLSMRHAHPACLCARTSAPPNEGWLSIYKLPRKRLSRRKGFTGAETVHGLLLSVGGKLCGNELPKAAFPPMGWRWRTDRTRLAVLQSPEYQYPLLESAPPTEAEARSR